MTNQTPDALVAEARRAVHESLVLLPAWEADRVRSLIADLEAAVESRTAIQCADAATSSVGQALATDQTPLRDRIAAAIWERQNPGRRYADCEYRWRADAEADAVAVLAVLPEPAGRASVLRAAGQIREDAALREAEGETELAQYGQELADLIAGDEAQPAQPKAPPMDPVHILGIGAPAAEAQQDGARP